MVELWHQVKPEAELVRTVVRPDAWLESSLQTLHETYPIQCTSAAECCIQAIPESLHGSCPGSCLWLASRVRWGSWWREGRGLGREVRQGLDQGRPPHIRQLLPVHTSEALLQRRGKVSVARVEHVQEGLGRGMGVEVSCVHDRGPVKSIGQQRQGLLPRGDGVTHRPLPLRVLVDDRRHDLRQVVAEGGL
ncbi:hypothetical protein E2C01_018342 [Portunus trituberculatus]|uniref:Uncharacterized protein n=1 Tax=Portunus trituberculatus TaxID=210409 RepID=A0A5B7DUW4_PORTR|nr:hypothetical protein [Portunus trituberculatus]